MSTKMTDIAGVFKHVKVNNIHMLKYAYFAEIDKTNLKLYTFPATNATTELGSKKNYSFISSDDNPWPDGNITLTTSKGYSCENVTFYGFRDYTYKPTTFANSHVLIPHENHFNANAMNIATLYFQFAFRCDLTDASSNEKIAMYFPSTQTLFNDEIISVNSCNLKRAGDNIYVTTTPLFNVSVQSGMNDFVMPLIALVTEQNDRVFVNSVREFELQDIAVICYEPVSA